MADFSHFEIDKFNLDNEAATQPSLYVEAGHEYSSAKREEEKLEYDLERIKAEVDAEVRNNPEAFGLESSPKEKAIAYVISKDKRVNEIYLKYIEAKERARFAMIKKEAYEQRKIMIRVLGDLWLGEYYSDIEVKKDQVNKFRKTMTRTRRKVSNP